MKFSFIVCSLLLVTFFAGAQNPLITAKPARGVRSLPDSIRAEFPAQHGLLIYQTVDFRDEQDKLQLDLTVAALVLERVVKSMPNITTPRNVTVDITAKGDQTIAITEPGNRITKITATEKEITQLLPPGWEVTLNFPHEKLYLFAQDFETLVSMTSWKTDPLKQLVSENSNKVYMGRKRIIARVFVTNGEITWSDIKFQMPQDFLALHGEAGFGYFNHNFYPELNLFLTFRFNDRFNRKATQMSVGYNNLFFATRDSEGKYHNRTNSFLTLSWSRSLGSNTWFTAGGGYLIYKTGDYFTGKTAKFYLSTHSGRFGVTPEFYLTDDLKKFQTGIKLSITF